MVALLNSQMLDATVDQRMIADVLTGRNRLVANVMARGTPRFLKSFEVSRQYTCRYVVHNKSVYKKVCNTMLLSTCF